LVKAFSRLLGQRKGRLATGLGIAAYTPLVGADPPVVRAAIMGGLSLLARQVGHRLTALLLADNGYAPLNTPEWIANRHPQVALLSTTPGDWDGLPSPETIQALEGYTLLRTNYNGWIELTTDGEQLWVAVAR
jgi:hypothetical protein